MDLVEGGGEVIAPPAGTGFSEGLRKDQRWLARRAKAGDGGAQLFRVGQLEASTHPGDQCCDPIVRLRPLQGVNRVSKGEVFPAQQRSKDVFRPVLDDSALEIQLENHLIGNPLTPDREEGDEHEQQEEGDGEASDHG